MIKVTKEDIDNVSSYQKDTGYKMIALSILALAQSLDNFVELQRENPPAPLPTISDFIKEKND